jgi:trypsin
MKIHITAILLIVSNSVYANDQLHRQHRNTADHPQPRKQRPTPINQLIDEQVKFEQHNNMKAKEVGATIVTPHIVNGVEVNPPGKYPFMTYAGGCGASLVAPNVLLCAAHCQGFISEVTIGRHNLSDNSETYETFTIAEEVPHPNYDSATLDYDYMMMRLDGYSSYDPVVLDNGEINLTAGKDVTVMGWGTTSSGGSASNVLREVEVDVWSQADCNNVYSPYGYPITDRMVCASRSDNGVNKDSCQGDSGGPIIDSDTGKQIGVVSWGFGCADPNFPGVYSRVQDQIDWINGYINAWSSGDPFPTKSPVSAPSYGNCMNDPNFIDSYGDDCSWYEQNAEPGCPNWSDCCDIGFGTPGQACCFCGGGISVTDPPVSSPTTASPTAGSTCSGITDKQTCNKTPGCGFNVFDNECRTALSTSECSAFDGKRRKCKKNGCKWRKNTSTCIGRWD